MEYKNRMAQQGKDPCCFVTGMTTTLCFTKQRTLRNMKNIDGKTENSLQIQVFVIPLQKNMDNHIYEIYRSLSARIRNVFMLSISRLRKIEDKYLLLEFTPLKNIT